MDEEELARKAIEQQQLQTITSSPDILHQVLKRQADQDAERKELLKQQLTLQLQKPSRADLSPAAAFADMLNGSSHLAPAFEAQAQRGEKENEANQKLLAELTKPSLGGQGGGLSGIARLGGYQERLNKNATDAGMAFEHDPLLKNLKTVQNTVSRGAGLLNSGVPITAQNVSQLIQDFGNALSNGGHATEGLLQSQSYGSLAEKVNRLESRFGTVKDLRQDPGAKAILGQIAQGFNFLGHEYSNQAADQAENIHNSFLSSDNPKVLDTAKRKFKDYAPERYSAVYHDEAPAAEAAPVAPKKKLLGAVKAKASGPAVGTVEDGHRFKGGNPSDSANWELVK